MVGGPKGLGFRVSNAGWGGAGGGGGVDCQGAGPGYGGFGILRVESHTPPRPKKLSCVSRAP